MASRYQSPIDQCNAELVTIWSRHEKWIAEVLETLKTKEGKPAEVPFLCPLQYPHFESGGVVFVGFNPSFSHRGWRTVLKNLGGKTSFNDAEINKRFARETFVDFLEEIKAWEALARQKLDFFKFHDAIEKNLHPVCAHLDLFAWRHTSQGEARALLVDQGNLESAFSRQQLEVFDRLLVLAKPKAIVVTNALASEIYLRHRGIEDTFDDTKGHYVDEIDGVGEIPVLPGGMLTGQRAMDRYSRQRLLWQLGQALDPKKNWNPGTTPAKNDPDALATANL